MPTPLSHVRGIGLAISRLRRNPYPPETAKNLENSAHADCMRVIDSLSNEEAKFPIMISNSATSLFFAHAGHGSSSGFLHGLMHPVGGLDHILAMVAVGVWAAMLGGRAVWLVPATFVILMAVGAAIGMSGFDFPAVEPGIGASVILLGLLITMAANVPPAAAAGIVGFFALFHGAAHGGEMPFAASGVAYGLGFLISTATLHLCGVALGAGMQRVSPPVICRTAGAAVAIAGGLLLAGML